MSIKDNFDNLPYPVVIIIGGGFGGLRLARKLAGKKYKVFLFDKNNYHNFQPLMYQVATGGLGSDAIAYPFRKVIGPLHNVAFRMAQVESINAVKNTIKTNVGDFKYDYLVIASGSATNYFGNAETEEKTISIKSIPEALDIRSLILQEFEKAMLLKTDDEKRKVLNFVIVGGGPTGVELAGAMAEIKTTVMPSDYRELDPELMNIHLLNSGERILESMSEHASDGALKFLQQMGVEVLLDTRMVSYNGHEIKLLNGNSIFADTVFWAAGVKGQIIKGTSDESINKSRYKVNEFNMLHGYNNIFAIGDVAEMICNDFPKGHPMVAPVAMQQADGLVKNLLLLEQNKSMVAFTYNDKGSMATVGRHKAVVDLKFYKFKGFFAWYIWMFLHLALLIGFRNRFIVLMNWIWSYFSYERAIRLIIRPYRANRKGVKIENLKIREF
jgi:NADH:ubiquinone reductase (H+-translocating)